MNSTDSNPEFVSVPQISLTRPFYTEDGNLKFELFDDCPLISIDNGPPEPFQMEYTPTYKHAMELFRGLMEIDEKTPRALAVTSLVISFNPRDEAVWWYRRNIYGSVKLNLNEELYFVDKIMDIVQVSYQAWNHRKWIVDKFQNAPDYKVFLISRIEKYPRNFHAWSYAQWYATKFHMEKEMIELTKRFIIIDSKNNSAWNLRAFLLKSIGSTLDDEVIFAFNFLSKPGGNEAICSYVLFLVKHQRCLLADVTRRTEEIIKKRSDDRTITTLLFHLFELDGQFDKAQALCDRLSKIDVLRSRFWIKVKQDLVSQLS